MNLISNMLSIFKWLFVRLPLGFPSHSRRHLFGGYWRVSGD